MAGKHWLDAIIEKYGDNGEAKISTGSYEWKNGGKGILGQKGGNNGFLFALAVLLLLFIPFITPSSANDTVAEITPKGLQFKIEENISIEREDLYISLKKIEVSYIFKNHSNKDITIEVAFPIPPYWGAEVANISFSHYPLNFSDFIVEVDGKKIDYKKEVRAFVNGKNNIDVTDILQGLNISIEDFGGFGSAKPFERNDILKLSRKDIDRLAKLHIIGNLSGDKIKPNWVPWWTVVMKYHWTQTFPANSTINIKHSYTPYHGSFYVPSIDDIKLLDSYLPADFVKDSCLDQSTRKSVEKKILRIVNKQDHLINFYFISYILTTANNWKKPIKDFHLILEKPENAIMSLCFDYKLTKTSPTRFESHIENFIPKKDLKIYFISGERD